MPRDIGILTSLDKPALPEEILKSTGDTNYTWKAFENDIQIDRLNQIIEVSGTTKLAQGIFKIILTPKGSHAEDPEYGTNASEIIGGRLVVSGGVVSERFAELRSDIIDALRHYNLINQDNPDSDEVIETIDDIRIVQDLDEPRALKIQIEITTESGKTLRLEVPQVS